MTRKTPPAPTRFTSGPRVDDEPALRAWLGAPRTAGRRLLLPVTLRIGPLGVEEAWVGRLRLRLDDTALGISVAMHALGPDGERPAEVLMWLEGRPGTLLSDAAPPIGASPWPFAVLRVHHDGPPGERRAHREE